MNNKDKKVNELRNIFLLCFLLGIIICFFNHIPGKEKKKHQESQLENVLALYHPAIFEEHRVRISKPVFPSPFHAESGKTKYEDTETPIEVFSSGTEFLQIKIFLKQNSYNLYFASGFHEPPSAA